MTKAVLDLTAHPHKEKSRLGQQRILVRVLERRFGLSLLPALHSLLITEAERLVSEGLARSLSQVIAKMTVAPEKEPVVQRMREAASIGETFFFRAPDQLKALATLAAARLGPYKKPGQTLRVWSAACASGEEPYTLAILLKTQFPHLGIHVHGSDMNPTALRLAKRGLYGGFSFRDGLNPRSLSPWLLETERGFEVTSELKRMVTFSKLNLVTDSFPDPASSIYNFDIISCRNVLIYIDPEKVPRVVEKLCAAAAPRSLLMLTPSEYEAARHATQYRDCSLGLLAREGLAPPAQPKPKAEVAAPVPVPAPVPRPAPRAQVVAPLKAVPAPAPSASGNEDEWLKRSESAADAGRYDEALQWIERLLARRPDSGVAYALQGMVQASSGQAERAVTSFERALFLDRSLVAAELGLGQVLARLKPPLAAPHFERALRLLKPLSGEIPVPLLNVTADFARAIAENALKEEQGE